jgi:osmoprotectant transport system ATP-binding protein
MLGLARLEETDLEGLELIVLPAPDPVRLGDRLSEAFAAIAALPSSAQGRVPVIDAAGVLCGSLTADAILAALRRRADDAGHSQRTSSPAFGEDPEFSGSDITP